MSVKINELTKIYGTQKALDAVSFSVAPGEVVGLLGPNGAGKSTIMKIITCFIPPTSGSASVCDFDVLEQSIEVRKKVGYLPENNPLYPDLYVREFLTFISGLHQPLDFGLWPLAKKKERSAISDQRSAVSQQRIDEIIHITGLEDEQHKKIGALSKGYRQRVGLAQALLHDPEVLILDEPTSGLDPNQLMEIRALIREIGREKTVILSTHIMQEVEHICSRAVIIHKGRIVADDTTQNLQHVASSRTLVNVEFSCPPDAGKLDRIAGVTEVKRLSDVSFQLSSTGDADIRPEIFRFAVEQNLTVLALHREELRLEEVFQELTRD
jgi:ABC-2 type transport system ATP-binding protein